MTQQFHSSRLHSYTQEIENMFTQNLYVNIDSSIIHNSPKW